MILESLYVLFVLFNQVLGATVFSQERLETCMMQRSMRKTSRISRTGAGLVDDFENEVPLCRLNGAREGDHPLTVTMLPGNKRAMYLTPENTEDVEVETTIQCVGEAPNSCKQMDGQCVPCPCKMDTNPVEDKYMQMMMEQIEPRCHAATEGQVIRILLIGLGGGAAPQHILAQCPTGSVAIHAVEIDKRVIKIAREYFGLPQGEHLQVENADATEALQQQFGTSRNVTLRGEIDSTELYDLALIDCMKGSGEVPFPCRSAQFIELLHKAVRKGGLVIQNIWHYSPADPKKVASQFRQTKADYMRIFGKVDLKNVPLPPEIDWENLIMAHRI